MIPGIRPDLWYAALGSPCGVILRIRPEVDLVQFKNELYQLRQRLADPDLDDLTLITSPFATGEFWLTKRTRLASEASQASHAQERGL